MSFLAPIWLIALMPWGALVVALLWGSRRQVEVPFVELWQGDEASPTPRRMLRLPPLFILATLLAMLLAILASAEPILRSSRGNSVTIIVDRGITMSASEDRLSRVISEVNRGLTATSVRLIPIPDGRIIETIGQSWPERALALDRTVADTREVLVAAVQLQLAQQTGPIVVLTDQPLDLNNPRLILMTPNDTLENVAIASVAARVSPRPQVMVKVRNQSPQQMARLRIGDDEKQIALPPTGQTQSYFFDPAMLGDVVHVKLLVEDDLAADNEAWLARQRTWPTIEPHAPIPPEVERMIAAYQKARPAGRSSRIPVVRSPDALGSEPGILLSADASRMPQELAVVDHPITANARFSLSPSPGTPGEGRGEGSPTPAGFSPIVYADTRAFVAVRDFPARQVWVGFDMTDFARTTDLVIFWTNVFDWLAGDGEVYASIPIQQLGPEWKPTARTPGELWPGVYQRGDGALLAMNAPDITLDAPPPTDGLDRLAQLDDTLAQSRSLAPFLLLASLICLAIAAIGWPARTYSARTAVRL